MKPKRGPGRRTQRGKKLERQLSFVALKEQHGLTYEQIGEITGLDDGYLRQLGCGNKPVTERTLRLISFSLAHYARTGEKHAEHLAATA